MEFPTSLHADPTTRAGRMFAEGDVRVTITDRSTGEHITVRFKAILDNRVNPRTGIKAFPDESKHWVRVPLTKASHVFLEVPSASGDFPDKIGTFYPRTGRFFKADRADPKRIEAACEAAIWLSLSSHGDQPVHKQYTFQEESFCGKCGTPLTDPESIARGIGPKCLGMATDSQHQVKNKQLRLAENVQVQTLLGEILSLNDEDIALIHRELDLWATAVAREAPVKPSRRKK